MNELRTALLEKRSFLNSAAEAYRDLSQSVALATERKQRYEQDVTRFKGEQARLVTVRERRGMLQVSLTNFDQQLDESNTLLEQARAALPQDLDDKKTAFENAKTESQTLEKTLAKLTETQAAAAEKLESVKLTLARPRGRTRNCAGRVCSFSRRNCHIGVER